MYGHQTSHCINRLSPQTNTKNIRSSEQTRSKSNNLPFIYHKAFTPCNGRCFMQTGKPQKTDSVVLFINSLKKLNAKKARMNERH